MRNATEIATIAIGLYERGFVKAALSTLDRGAVKFPESGRVRELLGILLHREQDLQRAQPALETASLLAPLSMAGEIALADCYSRSGSLSAAAAIYEHLLSRRNVPTARLAEVAAGLARCGKPHQALAVCRAAAQREPDNDAALFGMAHYMSLLAYPAEQILPLLQRVVALAPDDHRYRLALVAWLARLGCHRLAHEHLVAVPDDELTALRCACCVARLLAVCRAAGDQHRLALLDRSPARTDPSSR